MGLRLSEERIQERLRWKKKWKEEHKQKGRKKGFKHSEEAKRNMSIAQRARSKVQSEIMKSKWTPERREQLGIRNKERFKDPIKGKYYKEILTHDYSDTQWRKKISIAKQNIPEDEWTCFSRYAPYCEKFNKEFKERVRAFQGYKCALCGHIWEKGEVALAVHHIHYRKDSCCNGDAPQLFVTLCHKGCHQRTNTKKVEFIDKFTEYIYKEFKGKCFFTKDEMKEYLKATKKQ